MSAKWDDARGAGEEGRRALPCARPACLGTGSAIRRQSVISYSFAAPARRRRRSVLSSSLSSFFPERDEKLGALAGACRIPVEPFCRDGLSVGRVGWWVEEGAIVLLYRA